MRSLRRLQGTNGLEPSNSISCNPAPAAAAINIPLSRSHLLREGDIGCHKRYRLVDRLLVVSDAAAQFADPSYEAHLRYRLCVGAWPWKHVADFGDLTFRLLRGSIEFLTIYISGWILQGSDVCASWNGRRTREGLSVR